MAGRCKRFSASTTLPPVERGAKISNTERSKEIEVEARTPERSSLEKC
jgi:hypothetical protein